MHPGTLVDRSYPGAFYTTDNRNTMSSHFLSGIFGRAFGSNRNKRPTVKRGGARSRVADRRLTFESLESRQLLTVSAPTSIAFQPGTGQGTTALTSANDSSATTELTFLVSGVTAGNTVKVFADGGATPIATGTVTAGATTVTLTTSGTSDLSNGSHTFNATQTDTTGSASLASPGDTLQVFSGLSLTLSSSRATTATVGTAYSYTFNLQNNAPSRRQRNVFVAIRFGSHGNDVQFDERFRNMDAHFLGRRPDGVDHALGHRYGGQHGFGSARLHLHIRRQRNHRGDSAFHRGRRFAGARRVHQHELRGDSLHGNRDEHERSHRRRSDGHGDALNQSRAADRDQPGHYGLSVAAELRSQHGGADRKPGELRGI